jgi:PAS domain S-box-containing protein
MEAQTKPTRRVLILYETGTWYPAINTVDQGIRAGLQDAPYRLEFYREYMETVLFPDPKSQQEFREFYLRKYENRKLDVIIAVGPSPLKFMLKTHEGAFLGVPVIFCLPYGPLSGTVTSDPGITGVANVVEPAATLEVALRLKPETKHVIIVGGISTLDRQTEAMIQQRLRNYADRLDISYLTDLAMPALLKRLSHVPSDAIILFSGLTQDAAGTPFTGSESASAVTAAASVPVFVLTDSFLGHGEVGGKLFTRFEQGRVTGNMSLRVLNGEKPQDIPVVNGVTQYMFDWRALKRWGLKERRLPLGSIVLNRQATFWESYKWYVISGISLILLEALLISGLLWQRAKRRRAEIEQAIAFEKAKESEQRFRLVANTAPVMIWMSGPDKLCNYFNQPWLEFTGRRIEAVLGNGWAEGIHPEDMNSCLKTYVEAFDGRKSFKMQYRLRRYDGEYRWVFDLGVPRFNPDGSFAGYIGSCMDVTERKMAEEMLASVGRKLIEAHEEERTRIARELHDDINQRLALVTIELDRSIERVPPSMVEAQDKVNSAKQHIAEIATDIQLLSHHLHSSKLEYLGIGAAARGFCRELSDLKQVEIDFRCTGTPPTIPKEVSLGLFRVLQEALQNAVKHSGVRHFTVELLCTAEEVELSVIDMGVGFDPKQAINHRGLGLVSMKERMQLANGEFSIEAEPGGGTKIRARVPIKAVAACAATAAR